MTGPSILEKFWTKLDEMVRQAYEGENNATLTGEIKGIIWCIATMTNPYLPDIAAIRKEAVRRYKESHVRRARHPRRQP